jgi:predicted metal-binding membrane protein
MNAAFALEGILKRDRLIILSGLVGLTVLAWGYMIYEAHAMTLTGACCCAGMKMSGPDLQPWSFSTLLPLFLMWSEMMVAMMLPSAAPMILTFAMVNRKRREQQEPFVATGVFLTGYLLVWTAFSLLAAIGQWTLHGTALLSPMMVSTSSLLGGTLLVAAGVFQWTPFKMTCLRQCRSPLSFLVTDWREGRAGALMMGVKHGVYCTGCCWVLMALLFVAGVMNLGWVALIAAFVLLEKAAPRGMGIGKAAGLVLAGWGIWLMLN